LAAAACLGLLLAPTAAYAAENFTFDTALKLIDGVRVPATGSPFQGGRVFSFSNTTTFAGGRKATTTGKCSSWTAAAGSMFTSTGVCAVPDAYTLRFSCSPAADKPAESDCWGLLEMLGPDAKGHTGVVAFRRSDDSTRFVGVGTQN
jgi:hypothetical protein